jgi:outer membrane protein TolC
MRVRTGRLARRLGALALTGSVVGCASTPDPYGGARPLPPPPALTEKRAPAGRPADRSAGVVQVSAAAPAEPHVPGVMDPGEAVEFALANNPALTAARQQLGFARGAIVIAKTYPYNPFLQTYVTGDAGPVSAGITNHVFTEAIIRTDVEVRGQGTHRRAIGQAVLTRTEWEIATQELTVSIAATRAFNSVVYRQRKLQVLDDTIQFNEQVLDQVQKLVDAGRLRAADLIVARTELDTARAARGQGRAALAVARSDLRRQFGTLDDSFAVKGELDLPVPAADFDEYARAALERRPDVQARRALAAEAQARLNLQTADRYGNPSVGTFFEVNETSVWFIGAALGTPLPVFNVRRGEIMQAQATVARARAEVRQFEIQSGQDVQAALARLAEARKWVDSYTSGVLPNLRKAVAETNKLFEQNDPGTDVLKVINVQRNYLRAFDAYLDALFELSQARADLAAAVGDPALALGRFVPPAAEPAPPKKNGP